MSVQAFMKRDKQLRSAFMPSYTDSRLVVHIALQLGNYIINMLDQNWQTSMPWMPKLRELRTGGKITSKTTVARRLRHLEMQKIAFLLNSITVHCCGHSTADVNRLKEDVQPVFTCGFTTIQFIRHAGKW